MRTRGTSTSVFGRLKSVAAGLAASALILAGFSSVATAQCLETPADITGDGASNVVDIQCYILYSLWDLEGQISTAPTCSSLEPALIDTNCDGSIAVSDVLLGINFVQNGEFPESVDANGNLCADACEPDPTGADLIVTSFNVAPGTATAGLPIGLTASARNIGDIDTNDPSVVNFDNGNVAIAFFYDNLDTPEDENQFIGFWLAGPLSAGAEAGPLSSNAPFIAPAAGTYELRAFVDDINRVMEVDEDNNIVTTTITVEAPAGEVPGCTDNDAANFNDLATSDDGSCQYDVEFSVDMNAVVDFDPASDNVTLEGTFNGFCGGCATMDDEDGDLIYTITVTLSPGSYEHLFTINAFSPAEMLMPGSACDFVPGDEFINRGFELTDSPLTLDTVSFGECDEVIGGSGSDLVVGEFFTAPEVPMAGQAVAIFASAENLGPENTADNANFDNGNVAVAFFVDDGFVGFWFIGPMEGNTSTDPIAMGGDWVPPAPGTYTITAFVDDINRVNESNEDNNTKDLIVTVMGAGGGNPGCTDSDAANFDMAADSDDGSCQYDVTFSVDMNGVAEFDAAADSVYVNGTFNGFCGTCNQLMDMDGDGIYESTLPLPIGDFEYIYTVNGFDIAENVGGTACDFLPGDDFGNRGASVVDAPLTLDTVAFNVCEDTGSGDDGADLVVINLFSAPPMPMAGQAVALFSNVQNVGTESAAINALFDNGQTSSSIVVIGPDGTEQDFGFWLHPPLDPGAESGDKAVGGVWMPIEGGTYTIRATADHENRVDETDESNNVFEITVEVMGAPGGAGCTDSDAANFDPEVTLDDGSCTYNVDFAVDMNGVMDFDPATDNVFVNAEFNGFCGACNMLMDGDGDGIYTATLPIPIGTWQYLYTINGFESQESVLDTPCDFQPGDAFGNRGFIVVDKPQTLATAIYNVCDVVGGSDLIVDNFFTAPPMPNTGTPTAIFANALNTGTEPTSANAFGPDDQTSVAFFLVNDDGSEESLGFWLHPSLGPSESSGDKASGVVWTPTEPGIYTLKAVVDDVNRIDETDEGNNEFIIEVTVMGDAVVTPGCTDNDAANFNAAATMDDGSCTYLVTFNVDMSMVPDFGLNPGDAPFINGTFNGFCGTCNGMTDTDGDNLWTATFALPIGTWEFIYTINGNSIQESVLGTECDFNPADEFGNRGFEIVDAPLVLNLQPFDGCNTDELPETVPVTFQIDMSAAGGADPAGVFLAGGGTFGVPGDNPMVDEGDGIWSVTVDLPPFFTTDYTFANGACPNFACKENITGQDCAVPPFADRQISVATEPITIKGCFGLCTDDEFCPVGTVGCMDPAAANFDPEATIDGPCKYGVLFQVDMSGVMGFDPASDLVFVNGTFNGFCGTCSPMEDPDGDLIYTRQDALDPGNWLFFYTTDVAGAPNFGFLTQEDLTGTPCSGEGADLRGFTLGTEAITLSPQPYNGCIAD